MTINRTLPNRPLRNARVLSLPRACYWCNQTGIGVVDMRSAELAPRTTTRTFMLPCGHATSYSSGDNRGAPRMSETEVAMALLMLGGA